MIYLSAQPAEFYYIWQLEVQLYNFNRLGIKKKDIHILFGFNPNIPRDERVTSFIKKNKKIANFFFYEDRRPPSSYEPTIRPHIIKQHLNSYPYLENEYIFYHDCDIIFREVPNFKKLTQSNTWYMSNASDYIGAEGIAEISSLALDEMLAIVGINKKLVLNKKYTGGAQSLIKGTTFTFWDKIEKDSNSIHSYLTSNIKGLMDKYRDDIGTKDQNKGSTLLQPWCADMWALFWNGLMFGFDIQVHEELDFCWATQNIEGWESNKILHNAGVTFSESDVNFYKGNYRNKSPLACNFDFVDPNSCSKKYVEEIQAASEFYRYNLKNAAFLIIVRIDSVERLENLISITKFINKHFKTNIYVLEADLEQKINEKDLPGVFYEFIYDNNQVFNRAKYNNHLLEKCNSEIAILQDTDMVVDIEQIKEAVNLITRDKYQIICPFDTYISICSVDIKKSFLKYNDISLLKHDPRLEQINYYTLGGIVVIDRNWYKQYGYENKLIEGYGPDDIERIVRAVILGAKFKKVAGNIYHLSHPRNSNSSYTEGEFEKRFTPLLKVLSLEKSKLEPYIEKNLL